MARPLRNRLSLLRDRGKGAKSRFHPDVEEPALKRDDVRTSEVEQKIEKGSRLQKARLKFYPSIDVDFPRVYAGSIEGSRDDAKLLLHNIGFRNGPTAYVEVSDEFGADDGSYWLHIITETGKFPLIDNRVGAFRRIKDQIHVVIWEDEERGMTHFGAHREQSAPLQPARHVAVNDSDARRGIRDFRNKWFDELGEELPMPLDLPSVANETAEEKL